MTSPAFTIADDSTARRTALMLAVAGAITSAVTVLLFNSAPLVGLVLAPSPAWATLPITAFVTGTLIGSYPSSLLMKRFGRRPVFIGGALLGLAGMLLAVEAIFSGSFTRFVIAAGLHGVWQATGNYFRFAATDAASEEFRPKAISWVLTGGVAAGIIGTLIVHGTAHMLDPFTFVACYISGAALALLILPVLAFVPLPPAPPSQAETGAATRTVGQFLTDSRFLAAMLAGMISYGLMNLVMTGSSIAMVGCGLTVDDTTWALQWHVLAMYVPSFFTGGLIVRFGAARITAIGLSLLAVAGLVALSGLQFAHFAAALILLGLGWNFGFIGATALLTATYSPAEKERAQGINEFAISATVALASLSAGKLLAYSGWQAVNLTVFPLVGLSLALLFWLQRPARAAKTSS